MSNLTQQCPKCKNNNIIRQTGDNEPTTHYGRLLCGDCGRWISWLPDPCITFQWQSRTTAIDKLLINHPLTSWEQEFLTSVREQRKLSPKQKHSKVYPT